MIITVNYCTREYYVCVCVCVCVCRIEGSVFRSKEVHSLDTKRQTELDRWRTKELYKEIQCLLYDNNV